MQKQLMEEASSYRLLKALGEGRVEITFNCKPNPSCTSCASFSSSRIGEAFGFKVALFIGCRGLADKQFKVGKVFKL